MRKDNKEFSEKLKRRIYYFIIRLVKFTDSLPKNNRLCIIATDQLIRSGTSMGANYVEAIAGSSKKDNTNFKYYWFKRQDSEKSVIFLDLILKLWTFDFGLDSN